MRRWATITGGPRDGERVEVVGDVLREAVPARAERIDVDEPMPDVEMAFRLYDLRPVRKGTGPTSYRYVLRDQPVSS